VPFPLKGKRSRWVADEGHFKSPAFERLAIRSVACSKKPIDKCIWCVYDSTMEV
jgi:hypothetical protein